MKSKFNEVYDRLITESFLSDVTDGALKGGAIGAGIGTGVGAIGAGIGGAIAGATAGTILGLPLGLIAGAAKWLKNKEDQNKQLQQDKDCEEIKQILQRIDNNQGTEEDAQKLQEFEKKYNFEQLAEKQ